MMSFGMMSFGMRRKMDEEKEVVRRGEERKLGREAGWWGRRRGIDSFVLVLYIPPPVFSLSMTFSIYLHSQ